MSIQYPFLLRLYCGHQGCVEGLSVPAATDARKDRSAVVSVYDNISHLESLIILLSLT